MAAIALRIFFLALAALLASGSANAAELFGRIVAVGDGDTVTLLDSTSQQHKIRLSGIDAPERRQAYGDHAKRHLAALVFGRSVRVSWAKRDRYGRIIGRIYTAECARGECRYSADVGLEQIRAGLAWHYKQYQRDQSPEERAQYAATEDRARARREGLWSEPQPVPPWEFRHHSTLGAPASRSRG